MDIPPTLCNAADTAIARPVYRIFGIIDQSNFYIEKPDVLGSITVAMMVMFNVIVVIIMLNVLIAVVRTPHFASALLHFSGF